LQWLDSRLPVPKVVGFIQLEGQDGLLLSSIPGTNLAVLRSEWSVEKVIDKLVEALHRFHVTATHDCPFGTPASGAILVHGDACLPNFMFLGDRLSGYVDLAQAGIDNCEIDLSAAIWTLQYNLGSDYGVVFLKKYGVENASEELVKALRLQYEQPRRNGG
jgi:aminoglycoside phosphotransferase